MRGDHVIGLREVGRVVVCGTDPHAAHARTARARDVGATQVADVESTARRAAERSERRAEHARVGLRRAHLVGEDLRGR